MPPPTRLSFTPLEDRTVPAIFGVTWADPQNLSVSFAPDGTDVGGMKSDLNATLNAEVGKGVWQDEIRRAFQTWAVVTNLNIHVVSDNGDALGTATPLQGSVRVGDIRIASRPMSTKTVAVANPPDLISGWAGEIVLNSNYQFSAGGANGTYDLYSVMLHEIGHSLGLSSDFALDKSAVMHETYVGPRNGLSTADVTAIQKLYSARAADSYEGSKGNGTIGRATAIEYMSSSSQASNNYVGGGVTPTVVRADITTVGDTDVYKVTVPEKTFLPTLSLATSRISQLAAKVSVLDTQGKVLLSASADPGKDIRLDLKSLPAGKSYYVKVEANRADVFGIGEYRLTVGNALSVAVAGWFTTAFSTGGETLETNDRISGIDFETVRDNADARWDAVGQSQLADASDSHTISLTAANAAGALVVAVWASGDISPNLRVTDGTGKAVAFQVLRADGFATVLQILNAKKGATYNFTLTSTNWQQTSWMGQGQVGYRFAADLRDQPITLATVADGTLSATASTAARDLTITQSQLFRFELSANSSSKQSGASATLTITNSKGTEVFRLTAATSQTLADDVFLAPDTYTLRITGATTNGTLSPLGILARMTTLMDPIGPVMMDPTNPYSPPPTTTTPTTPPPTTPPPTELPPTAKAPTTEETGFFWGVSLVDPLKLGW